MGSDRARGRRYRLVLRGELGEPFGFLFEGMTMDRVGLIAMYAANLADQIAASIKAHNKYVSK